MTKRKSPSKPSPASGIGGTYKMDPETGELVKVSDGVPKVASKGRRSSPAPGGACGMGGGGCGRGPCS